MTIAGVMAAVALCAAAGPTGVTGAQDPGTAPGTGATGPARAGASETGVHPAPDRARAPPGETFTGKRFPPPGSPADQALLGDLLMAQSDMLNQRAWSIRATQHLADGRYDERLAALRASQPPEAAEATDRARRALGATWNEVTRIMTSRWPVDGRIGCRPTATRFEVLMGPADDATAEKLAAARESAQGCLRAQRRAVDSLVRANRDLSGAWLHAESLLAAAAPGPGTSEAPGGAAPASGEVTRAGRDR